MRQVPGLIIGRIVFLVDKYSTNEPWIYNSHTPNNKHGHVVCTVNSLLFFMAIYKRVYTRKQYVEGGRPRRLPYDIR